jgi:chromate reductase, NAD(P)H dehydrogenase (quinone)
MAIRNQVDRELRIRLAGEVDNMARNIIVLVGSIRKDSINVKLARALVKLAPQGFDFGFAKLDDLPLFNQDHDQNPAPEVERVKAQVKSANGLLFITPEHNRSIPTALKNVIDWVSRPYGKSLWPGKPAAIAGASVGTISTAVAQAHLRSMLGYLDVPTMGQPELYIRFTDGLITEGGDVTNESTRKFLQTFMETYVKWLGKFA